MTGASFDTSVLIIGAGPTGLSMAHELHRHGLDCRIVDKSPLPSVHSKALAIHARTLEVFKAMGVIGPILKKGQKIHSANFFVDGKKLVQLAFDDLDSPFPFVIALPQNETELTMLEYLSSAGVQVERELELVSIRQDKDAVYSTLKSADGALTVLKSQYVAACDGAHSAIRHALNLEFQGIRYPEAFMLADMEAQTELSDSEIYLFNTDDGLLALFPYGNKRWRVVADVPLEHHLFQVEKHHSNLNLPSTQNRSTENQAVDRVSTGRPADPIQPQDNAAGSFGMNTSTCESFPKPEPSTNHPNEQSEETQIKVTAKQAPSYDDVLKILNNRCPVPFKMSQPDWAASFAIHCRQLATYRLERIFFAGDAAHIHSPAGGQGMNTGIQDSFNLAWKLALVLKGVAKENILRSYNSERHEVAASVLKVTDFLTKVNTMRNPVAKAIRNRIAPILVNHESVQRKAQQNIAELSVNYRSSPIVAEHKVNFVIAEAKRRKHAELPDFSEWCNFTAGPHAGDRASDGTVQGADGEAKEIQLFDLFSGTQHHLLLFAGARSTDEGVSALANVAALVDSNWQQWIKTHFIAYNNNVWKDLQQLGKRYQDQDLSVHHRYGAATECLYLVRPDGYIAFRSMPAEREQLKRYLDTIFVSPTI